MAGVRIKDLTTRSSKLTSGDAYLPVDNGGSGVDKVEFETLAQQVIEDYEGVELAGFEQSVKDVIDSMSSVVNGLMGAVGSPLVASTVAGMTDQTKIYVYTGSETGYTAGNWYYYDGSAWTSGGVYNATAAALDDYIQHNAVSGKLELTEGLVPAPGNSDALVGAHDVKMGQDDTRLDDAFTELKGALNKDAISRINNVLDVSTINVSGNFVQGKGLGSDGLIFNSAKRIATVSAIDISSAKRISYTITNGYRLYIVTYSEIPGVTVQKVRTFGWLTEDGVITKAPNEKYMRVCIASINDSTPLVPSDADNVPITFTTQFSVDAENALVYRGGLTDNSDFDTINKIGIYNVPNNIVLVNAPDGFTGGTLIVVHGYSHFSTVVVDTQLVQVLISPVNNNIWMRYRSRSGSWNDWVKQTYFKEVSEATKWLAIGDSITFGVYSYYDGDTPKSGVTTNCWVRLLAGGFGYEQTVMASRGMGYTVSGQDPEDGSLPRIMLSELLNRIEALSEDYNLISLAFGINDYNTESSSIASIISSFNTTVERLITRFPHARLIIITPFNSCRRGDAETNYCYNYAYGGRSLKDIADAIKERCEYYGIECIYASNGFLFNNFNIIELQPDQVHPSAVGHRLIAKNMAHYFLF